MVRKKKQRNTFAFITPLLLAATFLVGMVKLWGVSLDHMLSFLWVACLFVLAVMGLGLCAALLIRWVRNRWDR